MESIIKNSIEYSGIINDLSQLNLQPCFKHLVLEETYIIPDGKPKFGKIIRVMSAITALNARIAGTPALVSLGGQILTGKKVVVDGEIKQKIEYTDIYNRELHAKYSITPFAVSIAVPNEYRFGTAVTAAGYIKDANVRLIDNSTIYKSMNLLISVEF